MAGTSRRRSNEKQTERAREIKRQVNVRVASRRLVDAANGIEKRSAVVSAKVPSSTEERGAPDDVAVLVESERLVSEFRHVFQSSSSSSRRRRRQERRVGQITSAAFASCGAGWVELLGVHKVVPQASVRVGRDVPVIEFFLHRNVLDQVLAKRNHD